MSFVCSMTVAREPACPLDALKELTVQLSLAASNDEIGRALLKVASRFGHTNALILDATKFFGPFEQAFVFATHTREDVAGFDARQPFVKHPFTLRARASEQPFLMSSLRTLPSLADDAGWREILPAAIANADGIVVPVHDLGQLTWCAAFAGAHADLSSRAQSVISAAVHAAHARAKLLEAQTRRGPLTQREIECLQWVAEGKTDFEVGKILGISPRTVRFHVNNAKVKLGVKTRIQAVAKGLTSAGVPDTFLVD